METSLNVKSVIEAITCPIHNEHPKIVMDDDNAVKLQCCCAEFKVQCFYILKKLLDGQDLSTATSTWDKNHKS